MAPSQSEFGKYHARVSMNSKAENYRQKINNIELHALAREVTDLNKIERCSQN